MIIIDARTLRILMDINSLQTFGAVQTYSELDGASSDLFNSMLEDTLGKSSASGSLLGTMSPPRSLFYNGTNTVFEPSTLPVSLSRTLKVEQLKNTANYGEQYEEIIRQAADEYNLPDSLLSSIIQHESNFNPNSVSRAGAEGLMQLMPGTAKFLGVTNSFDPVENIKGGAKYLRQMLNQFNGNIEHALAAYNAGPGNVRKYGGIPPFKETQNYVQKVLNTFNS